MNSYDAILNAVWGRSSKEVARLARENPAVLNALPNNALPLLHEAARINAATCGKALIDAGANVNVRGPAGDTPLHNAALSGAPKFCKLLIDCGADIDAYQLNYVTPLGYALFSWADGAPRCAKLLRKAGATEDLFTAIYSANDKLIADILRRSPRTLPIQRQVKSSVAELLKAWSCEAQRRCTPGADEEAVVREIVSKHLPSLDLLLENGAQVDSNAGMLQERAIFSALFDNRHKDILLRPLLERGADPLVQDIAGRTPLTQARETHNWAAATLLENWITR